MAVLHIIYRRLQYNRYNKIDPSQYNIDTHNVYFQCTQEGCLQKMSVVIPSLRHAILGKQSDSLCCFIPKLDTFDRETKTKIENFMHHCQNGHSSNQQTASPLPEARTPRKVGRINLFTKTCEQIELTFGLSYVKNVNPADPTTQTTSAFWACSADNCNRTIISRAQNILNRQYATTGACAHIIRRKEEGFTYTNVGLID